MPITNVKDISKQISLNDFTNIINQKEMIINQKSIKKIYYKCRKFINETNAKDIVKSIIIYNSFSEFANELEIRGIKIETIGELNDAIKDSKNINQFCFAFTENEKLIFVLYEMQQNDVIELF